MELFTITCGTSFEFFNLNTKLIDDAPGNYLLASDPNSCLSIISLSEEKLEMEQVAEAAALENLHMKAWKHWTFYSFLDLPLVLFESTDEPTLVLFNAAVQKSLEVAAERRELLDLEILARLQSLELDLVDTGEVKVIRIGLIVKSQVEDFLSAYVGILHGKRIFH